MVIAFLVIVTSTLINRRRSNDLSYTFVYEVEGVANVPVTGIVAIIIFNNDNNKSQ